MIRHILTLIWNQRRSNVWIFLELLLVAAILWVVTDAFYIRTIVRWGWIRGICRSSCLSC